MTPHRATMLFRALYTAILIAVPSTVSAQADAAASKLCAPQAYDRAVEGVWLAGDDGQLAFRVSWDEDGVACFAWLHALPAWGIAAPGASAGKVLAIADGHQFEDRNVMITLDGAHGATFRNKRSTHRTPGVLTARLTGGARETLDTAPRLSTRSDAGEADVRVTGPLTERSSAPGGGWVRVGDGRWKRI